MFDKEDLYSGGIRITGFVGLVGAVGYGVYAASSKAVFSNKQADDVAAIAHFEALEKLGVTTEPVEVITTFNDISRKEMKLIPIKELKNERIERLEKARAEGGYDGVVLPIAFGIFAGMVMCRAMFGTRLGETLSDFADNAGDFLGDIQDGAVRRIKKAFTKKEKKLPAIRPGD